MFGDNPDPTVTTVRVGSGTAFGRACEEDRWLTREDRFVLVVGRGLCRRPQAERRERERERDPSAVSETKTFDERPATIAAIDNRWAVKRTPNAMKLGRRSTDNKTTPHANFQPIPRTFPGHL